MVKLNYPGLGAILLALPVAAVAAADPNPSRGIALLASDIGHDLPVTNLLELVEKGGFAPVIIDWAWISYHWDRTDFKAVRELARRLRDRNIEAAAMYRPRFLQNPSVPEQVNADGSPAFSHGHYPCFSSPAARQWAERWGEKILAEWPELHEIIIYNPLDLCQCPDCARAKRDDPYVLIWRFLAEAKSAWRQISPTVKLGVVSVPDTRFWLRGSNIVDVARPFLSVREVADMNANVADIVAVQRILGVRAGAPLAKVTWGADESISTKCLSGFQRITQAQHLPYVLWTFDELFLSAKYDPATVAAALNLDYRRLEGPLRALRKSAGSPAAAQTAKVERAVTSAPLPQSSHTPAKPHAERDSLSPALTLPTPEPKIEKLLWPHQPPGLSPHAVEELNRQVWVINNNPLYQADERGTWCYFHGGLDIVLTNGAKIYAIKDGWVKAIANSVIAVADAAGGQPCYGWSYAHLGKFRVREGDFVKQGTLLGEVDFHGLPHTHLDKVFSQAPYWRSWRYVCFPDDHFAFSDDEPPTIKMPFYLFEHNRERQFAPQANGSVAVRGDVDIVVAMRDGGEFAHSKDSGFGDRLAVTRIEYTITPQSRAAEARHYFSFDFRKLRWKSGSELSARAYNTALVRIVFKHYAAFGIPPNGHQTFSYYIISHFPGDKPPTELDFAFNNCCWQTAARAQSEAPLYPDGDYTLEVTAFDSHDNKSTQSMKVTVDNAGTLLPAK